MRNRLGFTLLETLLAVSLTGVCVALFLPFLDCQRKIWERDTALREESETLIAAVRWLTRDLQTAGYGRDGSPILELEKDRISFVAAVEHPDAFADRREGMRLISAYENDGDLLYRIRRWDGDRGEWKSGSSHTLASDLTDISFSGIDGNGGPAVAPEDVRAVAVKLEGRSSGAHLGIAALRNAPSGREGGGD